MVRNKRTRPGPGTFVNPSDKELGVLDTRTFLLNSEKVAKLSRRIQPTMETGLYGELDTFSLSDVAPAVGGATVDIRPPKKQLWRLTFVDVGHDAVAATKAVIVSVVDSMKDTEVFITPEDGHTVRKNERNPIIPVFWHSDLHEHQISSGPFNIDNTHFVRVTAPGLLVTEILTSRGYYRRLI